MERFSFRGRSSRLTFWREMLAANVLAALVWVAAIVSTIYVGRTGMILFIGLVPIIIWSTAAGVRRLHDLDRSGPWLALFWALPTASSLIAQDLLSQQRLDASWIGFALAGVSLLVWLWGIWDMGFRRGDSRPNSFGPPVDGRPKQQSSPPPQSPDLRSRLEAGFD